MSQSIASRTPEGDPNTCPICHGVIWIEPSQPSGDAPCPSCGALLWFVDTSEGRRWYDAEAIAEIRAKLLDVLSAHLGLNREQLSDDLPFREAAGIDSLGVIELVMQVEEQFHLAIPDEVAEKITTVRDLLAYLARREKPDE
jgi:acyl carrier protein